MKRMTRKEKNNTLNKKVEIVKNAVLEKTKKKKKSWNSHLKKMDFNFNKREFMML